MSLLDDLKQRIDEQAILIDSAHKWLWDHTEHRLFREQSAKYNALVRHHNSLVSILGFVQWLSKFNREIQFITLESLHVEQVVIATNEQYATDDFIYYEDVAKEWIRACEEQYNTELDEIRSK